MLTVSTEAFEEAKRDFLLGISLKEKDIYEHWGQYFDLLYRIRKRFEQERDSWRELLKGKSMDEQKDLAKTDYRGGRLVDDFPLLPEFGDAWQPITLDSLGLGGLVGTRGKGQEHWRKVWSSVFDVGKVVPDPERAYTDRSFHYMILTDGVCAGVLVNTMNRTRRKAYEQWESVNQVSGIRPSTLSELSKVRPENLLNKVIISVDTNKDPIIAAGYYQIVSTIASESKDAGYKGSRNREEGKDV
ncbi:uncharacterized protein SPPG_03742 [Spizellomyces punctatus DAOM BR117]|uniref:Uncharacterized protein n=1 Tax=Spizellomyces punctatus (strain DAOM BR117) TaxID=645134 RepID=A0A0L0HIC1_SPIPD|nr:uncharacterized protein SPPG_03742 [Spizellomyces punctatus DAOM BR117]KND00615.1 hypothetical protein SPPG_03742 [Spizellomyces punctatus DAOM BR117]|eukprot:XP_016608654.1 hypothetical protein SPPG_03742 [Spizellomyces punctatus DAOM BR117]